MLTRVLPLAIRGLILRWRYAYGRHHLIIEEFQSPRSVTFRLSGFAVAGEVEKARRCFRDALVAKKLLVIDFSQTSAIDQRFIGLLLMVRKQSNACGVSLKLAGIPRELEKAFRLNGVEYLLSSSNRA
jgi:N-acetylglucosaminyldiphosphoundecaprenol N-acetyl-beta-D-mannosaminyltransferase